MIDKMRIKASGAVLVIVDVQERLAKVMDRREQVEGAIGVLIRVARLHDIPVVLTQQYTRGLGPTVKSLAGQLEGVEHVEKIIFSCCGEEPFNKALDGLGRKKVILTGMEAHICVYQTALDLIDSGYSLHVPWDAVCSRSDGNRDAALRSMERAGAVITSSETVAFQILGKAGTPEFKEISALLR
ncbi:MAG: hydrolase [bacterium]|nr:hydrolase [bacterium]MDT8396659.1 hydrolase [bacterium]